MKKKKVQPIGELMERECNIDRMVSATELAEFEECCTRTIFRNVDRDDSIRQQDDPLAYPAPCKLAGRYKYWSLREYRDWHWRMIDSSRSKMGYDKPQIVVDNKNETVEEK